MAKNGRARRPLAAVCDRAVEIAGTRFAAVNAAARRAHQLNRGYPPLVDEISLEKPVITALREIAEGKIEIKTPGGNMEKSG